MPEEGAQPSSVSNRQLLEAHTVIHGPHNFPLASDHWRGSGPARRYPGPAGTSDEEAFKLHLLNSSTAAAAQESESKIYLNAKIFQPELLGLVMTFALASWYECTFCVGKGGMKERSNRFPWRKNRLPSLQCNKCVHQTPTS